MNKPWLFLVALISFAFKPMPSFALDEVRIGNQVAQILYAKPNLNEDPIVLGALSRLLRPIHRASAWRDRSLRLVLLADSSINAFAAPGGVLGFHTGLIEKARSSDQLASVIAHEMAHITQRHFSRRQDANSNSQTAYLVGTLAAIAAGVAGNASVGAAALTTTQAAAIDQALAFSREHEREADRLGLELMTQAGFDPTGMSEMFATMQADQRLSGQPLAYLSTHPLSSERVADAKNRLTNRSRNPIISGDEYQWWQRLARNAQTRLSIEEIQNTTPAHSRIRYQLLARLHQQNENWDALDAVLKEASLSFPHDLALGLIASQRRSPTDAMRQLERLAEHYPYVALPLTRAAQRARQLNWEPEFHYYSGLAQLRMGGIERAKEHLALVASMDSPFAAQAKAELTALR